MFFSASWKLQQEHCQKSFKRGFLKSACHFRVTLSWSSIAHWCAVYLRKMSYNSYKAIDSHIFHFLKLKKTLFRLKGSFVVSILKIHLFYAGINTYKSVFNEKEHSWRMVVTWILAIVIQTISLGSLPWRFKFMKNIYSNVTLRKINSNFRTFEDFLSLFPGLFATLF